LKTSKLLLDLADYEEATGKRWEDCYPVLKEATVQVNNRQSISKKDKAHIWSKTEGLCYHCGLPLNPFSDLHIDHLIPLCQGGPDTLDNMVPSCSGCNLRKGGRL